MSSSHIKFLLVDDLEDNLLALGALLKHDGLELCKARSGPEALELLLQHEFALAILDVQMPGMDGFELAQLMRGTERTRRVPIIFLTAGTLDLRRRFEGYEAGAVDFLFKPIEPHVLRSKCGVFFDLAVERHELARNRDHLRDLAEENARLLEETRRKAEALALSEHRFRVMADGTPLIIWVTDDQGKLQFVNQAYCQFFGATIEKLQGDGWQPLVFPEDTSAYVDVFLKCVQERKPFHAQARFLRHDGQWRWIASYGQPIFTHSGTFTGMAGSSLDVTEQKAFQEELGRLVTERTRELRETNEQLNAFCYSMAHDLKAPLRAQAAFAAILEIDYKDALGQDGCAIVRRIKDAARRQGRIVEDLLSHMGISRTEMPLQPVELGAAVQDALLDLNDTIQAGHASIERSSLSFRVLANPASFHLVLVNLLSNALKFVKPGSQPRICIAGERNPCHSSLSSPVRSCVRLSVQDNGIGVAREYWTRIFGVFQRLHTSQIYAGTGIGLAVVKVAIERMGGCVGLDSTPGEGSRFWIDLSEANPDCEQGPGHPSGHPSTESTF